MLCMYTTYIVILKKIHPMLLCLGEVCESCEVKGCSSVQRTSRQLSLATTKVISSVISAHIYRTHLTWADWGLWGLCLCNKSSSSMWFGCPLPFPSQKRVTQDTREKKIHLNAWTPPLASSPNAIIKPPSTGCEGLSHRQPVSGGSPIAFVHFFPSFFSFSAEPLLPRGWVRPVPVLLRLDTTEATKKKSLEVDVNNFPQPELCASHIRAKQLALSRNDHSESNGK